MLYEIVPIYRGPICNRFDGKQNSQSIRTDGAQTKKMLEKDKYFPIWPWGKMKKSKLKNDFRDMCVTITN